MKRRRFIVTGISVAAAGLALGSDACSGGGGGGGSLPPHSLPSQAPPPPGVHVHELTAQYAVTTIKGYKLRTRTYGGRTLGPPIETRPGKMLAVRIVNRLPQNRPARVPQGSLPVPAVRDSMQAMNARFRGPTKPSRAIDRMNNPHGFNTTNLHVHGIQTIPHIFSPLGTSDPSAPMLTIDPGKSFLYKFPVPADQPSGLHWYHPHKHGSTDVQLSGGMAGAIVVRGAIDEVPEISVAREIFLIVQSLNVNPSKTQRGLYEREYVAYEPPAKGGYSFGTQFTMLTVNGDGIYWIHNAESGSAPVFTPLGVPEFQVSPGEVVRLRLLNGTNFIPLFLALPEFYAWQIGFDGVNTLQAYSFDMTGAHTTLVTPENLFTAPIQVAAAANRIELLLQAPKKEGTYALSSLASSNLPPSPGPKFELARFVVTGGPKNMRVPTVLPRPRREYPIIGDRDIVTTRRFLFSEGPRKDLLTGFGFTINGALYDEMMCPTQPKVGTCEEWIIENDTPDLHPFHLHDNAFQLFEVNGKPVYPIQIWDTYPIPPKYNGVNGRLRLRVRFKEWTGKSVLHCHVAPHSDTGMMQNVLIT